MIADQPTRQQVCDLLKVTPYEKILALDCATKTGYYCKADGGGTWYLNRENIYREFRDKITEYIKEHDIKIIVAEDVFLQIKTKDAGSMLLNIQGILRLICADLKLPQPILVQPQDVKYYATRNKIATKDEMVKAAIKLGLKNPVTDDHADAFLIWKYFLKHYPIR